MASEAAVLIPIIAYQGGDHLLFIRRAQRKSDRHSGQVAFPGGMCDPTDNNVYDTAIRETREEIGVHVMSDDILAKFDPFETGTGFTVTPIVARLSPDVAFKPDAREVARVFTIPIDWLVNAGYREELLHRDGVSHRVIYYDVYDGEQLWGVSARITQEFLRWYIATI